MKINRYIFVFVCMLLFIGKVDAHYYVNDVILNLFHSKAHNYIFLLNGGKIVSDCMVDSSFHLPEVEKDGYVLDQWLINDNTFEATWVEQRFIVDVNSMIDNKKYNSGLSGFTFDIYKDGKLYKDDIIDFCEEVTYGTRLEVVINPRKGYSINGIKKKSVIIKKNVEIVPTWIDNISPTIDNFEVINYGFYNPSVGDLEGWNIKVIIHAYDYGSGITSYENWLVPYSTGMGGTIKSGSERYMTNVLYLDTGRTFCASVTDSNGNKTEKCDVITV